MKVCARERVKLNEKDGAWVFRVVKKKKNAFKVLADSVSEKI